ncbi:predicted protein [Lichtheimia corymbifera JMRC:FSU:9682]|uniref:K Homology domain-containing protein n=1 Tax=Lichtheimia corymbifera JMRC:FSU:9682 TaxID=1263082 RepID=A0A068S357_9FUNG|nr:predicted protein [Lichtheimia corymbifera JMRC:FSU:9682]
MQFGRKFESIINDDPAHTPVTLRAVIPPDKPGALIGVKGQVHRQIEDMFNVRLVLHMVRDQYGRLLQIFGHPKRIAPALRDALIRMYGQRQFELNYGQEIGVDFLIPKLFADWLVENDQLARIHRVSKVSLRLYRRCLPHTTDQILKISVSSLRIQCMDEFETAVRMLAYLTQKNIDKAMSPYNVYHVPGSTPNDINNQVAVILQQQPDISKPLPDVIFTQRNP